MKALAIARGFYEGHLVEPGTKFEFDEKRYAEEDGTLPSWVVEQTAENLAKVGDVLPTNHGMVDVIPAKKKGQAATYKVATPEPTVQPNSGDTPRSMLNVFPDKVQETADHDAKRAEEVAAETRAVDTLARTAAEKAARIPRPRVARRQAARVRSRKAAGKTRASRRASSRASTRAAPKASPKAEDIT